MELCLMIEERQKSCHGLQIILEERKEKPPLLVCQSFLGSSLILNSAVGHQNVSTMRRHQKTNYFIVQSIGSQIEFSRRQGLARLFISCTEVPPWSVNSHYNSWKYYLHDCSPDLSVSQWLWAQIRQQTAIHPIPSPTSSTGVAGFSSGYTTLSVWLPRISTCFWNIWL